MVFQFLIMGSRAGWQLANRSYLQPGHSEADFGEAPAGTFNHPLSLPRRGINLTERMLFDDMMTFNNLTESRPQSFNFSPSRFTSHEYQSLA
jgi:hypothetical protein